MFSAFLIDAAYFVAAFLFLYGLKRMASPVTARSGIVVAGGGMLVAVVAAFLYGFDVSPRAEAHLGTNLFLLILALGLGTGWAWFDLAVSCLCLSGSAGAELCCASGSLGRAGRGWPGPS